MARVTPHPQVPASPPVQRRNRTLDAITNHARQGVSGERYVAKVLNTGGYSRSPYRLDEGFLPDPLVGGSRVGDVDFLIRRDEHPIAVLLEVKTSDPHYGAQHRRQAARAAEATRIADSTAGGCTPIPVVVYVDSNMQLDAWKQRRAAIHPCESVYPSHPVHSVGARHLNALLRRLFADDR